MGTSVAATPKMEHFFSSTISATDPPVQTVVRHGSDAAAIRLRHEGAITYVGHCWEAPPQPPVRHPRHSTPGSDRDSTRDQRSTMIPLGV